MATEATIDVKFQCPGPQPNGLQAADDGLWYIDQRDHKVYKLDWNTGETLFEAQTSTDRSSGITIGGGYGLEHLNSTSIVFNHRMIKQGMIDPLESVTVHEFIHLWNVKRIRHHPCALRRRTPGAPPEPAG